MTDNLSHYANVTHFHLILQCSIYLLQFCIFCCCHSYVIIFRVDDFMCWLQPANQTHTRDLSNSNYFSYSGVVLNQFWWYLWLAFQYNESNVIICSMHDWLWIVFCTFHLAIRNCDTFFRRSQHQLEWNEKGHRRARQRARRNRTLDRPRGVLRDPLLSGGIQEWVRDQYASRHSLVSVHVCIATNIAVVVRRWMGSRALHHQSDVGSAMEIRSGLQNCVHRCVADRFES